MKRSGALQAAAATALAWTSAEAGVRLLSPREPATPALPVKLGEHFSTEEIRRARRYTRPQIALGLAQGVVDVAALVQVWRWRRRRSWRNAPGFAPGGGARAPSAELRVTALSGLQGALLTGALSLPSLPLAALARRRALQAGLSTQGWRGWAGDLLKATAIQAGMAGVGAGALTAAARRWPRGWWLPAAGGLSALGAGLATLAPVLLDPVFNDFTPLLEGDLRRDVLELAGAAGVSLSDVYSVDASRRTTAANAYVTGLGPSKRVVLFDTMLERYSREEVLVVVAHELAHVRHRDVARSVTFAALIAPAATLAVQRLSWVLSPARGNGDALPALALAAGLVSAPIGLVSAQLSRAVERRADAFSLELSGEPEAFVSFERKIVLQNLADPAPPRILSLLASHPPTDERIGRALWFGENGRPAEGQGRR